MADWQRSLGLDAPFVSGVGHECSAPLVTAAEAIVPPARGKRLAGAPPVARLDELVLCGHLRYARGRVAGGYWRQDLALSTQFGAYARYAFPWWRDRAFDWVWADQVVAEAERLGLRLIVDCLHYGIPLRLGGVWGPAVPAEYARFMRRFCRRYKSALRFFTPVNELFLGAEMATLGGVWNNAVVSGQRSHADFVRVLGLSVEAAQAAWREIMDAIPDAVALDSDPCDTHPGESELTATHPGNPLREELKHVGWDLLYGLEPEPIVVDYLQRFGMSDACLGQLLAEGSPERRILGFDYYVHHDRNGDGGFYPIARAMLDRFARKAGRRIPCMLAEINGEEPWVRPFVTQAWEDALRLHAEGDCCGFIYYSLIDQADWDHHISHAHGHLLPIGLYDTDRRIRPVGDHLRALVAGLPARLAALHARAA